MSTELIKEALSDVRDVAMYLGENQNLEWVLQSVENTTLYTESPIERRFMLALTKEIIKKNGPTKNLFENPILVWTNEVEELFPEELFGEQNNVLIFINPTVGKYRPDILISNFKKSLIFEIDGYEFHNTRQQLTKDKIRERELSKLGHKLYRFSGTEIHRDEQKVAQEALEIIYKEFELEN